MSEQDRKHAQVIAGSSDYMEYLSAIDKHNNTAPEKDKFDALSEQAFCFYKSFER